MIHYIKGDATAPQGEGNKFVVHICNDIGGWGKGFVLALSRRWKSPEEQYRRWHKGYFSFPFELGVAQIVQVERDIWVANLIGQHKIRPIDGVPPVRYDAIRKGLRQVARLADDYQASIHMPRIGCGLAGGQWSIVEEIIAETLSAHEVFVYDLE